MRAVAWILPLVTAASAGAAEGADTFFQQLDLSAATPSGFTGALSYTPTFRFFDRLNTGLGARFSSFFGGEGVAFPNGDPSLIAAGATDRFIVDQPRSYALNLMFAIALRLFAGLEVGMNIDLVGVGFGPHVTGEYVSTDPTLSGPQRAGPSRLNLLLFGTHDHGQLDSEFFAAYWSSSWGIRVGASHMSTEYTTDNGLIGNNDRFRASYTRVFASVGYRF